MKTASKRQLEARWANAVRKAERVKRLVDAGYIVRMVGGDRIHGVTITEDQVLLAIGCNATYPLAYKSAHGFTMQQSIPDFNKQFKGWYYYQPDTGGNVFTDKELK